MKVEPRGEPAANFQTFVGMILKSVRVASKELVLSFGPAIDAPRDAMEAHLICQPEGNIMTPPNGGQPFVRITGMKYEVGIGGLTILADCQELAGEASEVVGRTVTQASYNSRMHCFGLQLGPEYGIVITPAGMAVPYTKELVCEFRKPLVTQ
jgi:hypothetical protein